MPTITFDLSDDDSNALPIVSARSSSRTSPRRMTERLDAPAESAQVGRIEAAKSQLQVPAESVNGLLRPNSPIGRPDVPRRSWSDSEGYSKRSRLVCGIFWDLRAKYGITGPNPAQPIPDRESSRKHMSSQSIRVE